MSEDKPKPKPDNAVTDGDTVDLVRVAAVCDMLKVEAERLNSELATMKQDLDAAYDARKERERLLDLLATQQRSESRTGKSALVLERSEMALAQAVLIAQQRAKLVN